MIDLLEQIVLNGYTTPDSWNPLKIFGYINLTISKSIIKIKYLISATK